MDTFAVFSFLSSGRRGGSPGPASADRPHFEAQQKYTNGVVESRSGSLTLPTRGTLAVLVHAGTVDEAQIGAKTQGYERKFIICATKQFKDVSVPFWNQLPVWVEKNELSPTTWQVVAGLDTDKINQLLDGYVQGKTQLKPHVHI